MDLNELLSNHQRALMNARQARSMVDKKTYFDLVGYYAKRIQAYRDRLGLPRASWLVRSALPEEDHWPPAL
jgi:hypothetical protein